MLQNILGKIASQFLKKKSLDDVSYIKYYIDEDDIKIEFSVANSVDFAILASSVLNGKLRESSISSISSSLSQADMLKELEVFNKNVSRPILPSEFII